MVALAGALGGTSNERGADKLPHVESLVAIQRAAQKEQAAASFPVQGLPLSPQRAQALFAIKHHVSATTKCALRLALGGNGGPTDSREVLRVAREALSAEPAHDVREEDRGAHLVCMRAALEAPFSEMVVIVHLLDSYVRGPDGAPMTHSASF